MIPAVIAASLAAGFAVSRGPVGVLAIAVLVGCVFMLPLPSSAWVGAALVTAVVARGLVGIGVLPGYAQFVHLPLAWGALAVALIISRQPSELATRVIKWLFLLAGAVAASVLVNQPEALRGPAYFALLAEPFAIIAALLCDPPGEAARRRLLWCCGALVAVQVPICYLQAATLSWGDLVQGTQSGAGAGAHVVGGIVAVGAFWYIARADSVITPRTILVVGLLLGIVLVADAKQVAFVLPAAVVAQRGLSRRSLVMLVVAAACVLLVVQVGTFNQGYAVPYIDRALSGGSGKQAVTESVAGEAARHPGVLLFGRGPAESVSRAAFETVPAYQKGGSGLSALGLHPAQVALDETAVAQDATGSFSLDSFDSAMSSGIGVFGDLGVLGAVAYLMLAGIVFAELRRRSSPEASAAVAGMAMALVLGFVLDWWEQPAFTVFLATLAGLALLERPVSTASSARTTSADMVPPG